VVEHQAGLEKGDATSLWEKRGASPFSSRAHHAACASRKTRASGAGRRSLPCSSISGNMPTHVGDVDQAAGRPSASTTGNSLIFRWAIAATASIILVPVRTVTGRAVITSRIGRSRACSRRARTALPDRCR